VRGLNPTHKLQPAQKSPDLPKMLVLACFQLVFELVFAVLGCLTNGLQGFRVVSVWTEHTVIMLRNLQPDNAPPGFKKAISARLRRFQVTPKNSSKCASWGSLLQGQRRVACQTCSGAVLGLSRALRGLVVVISALKCVGGLDGVYINNTCTAPLQRKT
jgi:hypothetical protein